MWWARYYSRPPQILGRCVAVLLFLAEVDDIGFARVEALRRLAPVDVIAQEHVEHLACLPSRARQRHDLRVVHREHRELALEGRFNEELLLIRLTPEVRMIGDQTSQDEEELSAHVGRAFAVLHTTNAPAFIHQIEEGLDVLAHVLEADDVDRPIKRWNQRIDAVRLAGRLVRVDVARTLREGKGRNELAPRHALAPGHTVVHDEVPGVAREAEEHQHGTAVLATIAQENVRRHLGTQGVQGAEAITLPFLGRVEVHHSADANRGVGLLVQEVNGGRDALESVDDVDGIQELDRAVLLLLEVLRACRARCPAGTHCPRGR